MGKLFEDLKNIESKSKTINSQIVEVIKDNENDIRELLKLNKSKTDIVKYLNKNFKPKFKIVEVYNPRKKKIEKKKPTFYIHHLNSVLKLEIQNKNKNINM